MAAGFVRTSPAPPTPRLPNRWPSSAGWRCGGGGRAATFRAPVPETGHVRPPRRYENRQSCVMVGRGGGVACKEGVAEERTRVSQKGGSWESARARAGRAIQRIGDGIAGRSDKAIQETVRQTCCAVLCPLAGRGAQKSLRNCFAAWRRGAALASLRSGHGPRSARCRDPGPPCCEGERGKRGEG